MKLKLILGKKVSLMILTCLLSANMCLYAQGIQITGVVNDDTGDALLGVSVAVVGTTNGTVTGMDGRYTITVPNSSSVLQFSYVGFTTQTVTVGSQRQINITMGEDLKSLDEVVVIGYGTQRREAVTGSVASMQGNVLREVQTGNITEALAGRIAGVQFQQTNSRPGQDMEIRIRGVRSLSANNDPIIVLDGIPFGGNLGDINPNDIKSIDVLKDAASTAIYGSRGANGVIMVTTNKGTMNQKATVNYNGYYGLKTLFARFPMMSGEELYEVRRIAGRYSQLVDGARIPGMGIDEELGMNTDWQDLMFKNASTISHNIGISSGSQNGSYSFGVGYTRDEALMPGTDFTRLNLRASIDQRINKYFRFGLNTSGNFNINNGESVGLYAQMATSPLINPYNADGTFKRTYHSVDDQGFVETREARESQLGEGWVDQRKSYATYNSLFGEVRLPNIGLSYQITTGLDLRFNQRGQFTGTGVFNYNPINPNSGTLQKQLFYQWTVEHLLTYQKEFGKHSITANLLYSAEQSHNDRSYMTATRILNDKFQFWNLGRVEDGYANYDPGQQQYSERALISQMGRVIYNYDNRYMFMASLRRDGASVLAPGYKYITYPAISVGWNINREEFMKNIKAINNLKLRAGWGRASNQSIAPYETLGTLTARPYNFGLDNMQVGYHVSSLPNPTLGWEYTTTWNIGVDFNLLKNRLNGTIEYYYAHSYDLIQEVNLPQSSAVSSIWQNIGEMDNKGIELTLNGIILQNKNGWTWSAGINLYSNKNKIVNLARADKYGRDISNRWFVGSPVNVIYDYKYIGLWQEGDPYIHILHTSNYTPGMIKVAYNGEYDANGAPVRLIGEGSEPILDDRQIQKIDPDFQGGFNTRVAYKNWDLNIIGTFQRGGKLISSLHMGNGYLNLLTGRRGNVKVDYWTPENTGAKYPTPSNVLSGDNQYYMNTLGYFNATNLRVGQITLGYNLNKNTNLFQKLGMGNMRLYFTLQNAFTLFSEFTKETGLDTVTNSRGNANVATQPGSFRRANINMIGTNVPQTRNYILGLNLSF